MAAPSLAPVRNLASRRGVPRHPTNIPLDIVALRSGVPNTIPGRCTDLSETGIGALIAGELIPNQSVAVELRLPNVGLAVRARAQVRYQERLRCGLQFVGLSAEQREKIRYWASQFGTQPAAASFKIDEATQADLAKIGLAPEKKRQASGIRAHRRLFFLLLTFLLLAGVAWWQWQNTWNELETDASSEIQVAPLRVPENAMRILYKVDPIYPENARRAGTQGAVVLDALIAQDGTVKSVRPVAGPTVLAQSAMDAVRSWKFEPYRANQEAIEVETTVILDFRLH